MHRSLYGYRLKGEHNRKMKMWGTRGSKGSAVAASRGCNICPLRLNQVITSSRHFNERVTVRGEVTKSNTTCTPVRATSFVRMMRYSSKSERKTLTNRTKPPRFLFLWPFCDCISNSFSWQDLLSWMFASHVATITLELFNCASRCLRQVGILIYFYSLCVRSSYQDLCINCHH